MSDFSAHPAVKLAQELIRIPSLSGGEAELAEFAKSRMEELGFDEAWVDEYNSVIGVIRGRGDGCVLLDGHIDTVPVSDEAEWTRPPFDGLIENGRLYGRGSSDMKSAFGAMLLAAAELAREKENLPGTVVVTGTAMEELVEGHTLKRACQQLSTRGIKPRVIVIGESTGLRLNTSGRGRAEIVVRTMGRSCHASNPELGVNAVALMAVFIERLKNLKGPHDIQLGEGIYEITDIISNPYPGISVVPNECRLTIDRRTLVGETEATVLVPIRKLIEDLEKADDQFKARVAIESDELVRPDGEIELVPNFAPAWRLEWVDPAVQAGLKGLTRVGLTGLPGHYSFCTNAAWSAGRAKIPTLGFGPSRENLAHVADEYIELDQLTKAYDGYLALIKELILVDD